MLQPETYRGYDIKDHLIGSKTAKDAKNDIDPDEIKAKAENVEAVVDDCMSSISASLDGVVDDANNALVVNGKSMAPSIEAANESIKGTQTSIKCIINSAELYSEAEKKHDELQEKYNKEAENYVRSRPGFDHLG